MKTEVFLICTNRKDGRLPDPIKICDSGVYFAADEAENRLRKLVSEIGPYYGVYRGSIEITERVE